MAISVSSHSAAVKGTVWTLLAAAGFSAVSILTTVAMTGAGGASLSTVLAWRYVLASVLLGGWLLVRRPERRMAAADIGRWLTIGGGGQALLVWLALSSLAYINAATLAFLFYTYPCWVALIQAARGAERIDRQCAVALLLSFLGIAVMVGAPQGGAAAWKGYAFALAAAIVYGMYIPAMALMQNDLPVESTTLCAKIGSAVCFVVLAQCDQTFAWHFDPTVWGAIVALTVLSTLLPSLFFLMGLLQLGPVRAAIISTVEPFMTALLGMLALHQGLAPNTLIGGAMIAAAVILLQVRQADASLLADERIEGTEQAP